MNSAANVMKRHNMTDEHHHHFLWGPRGMLKLMGHFGLSFSDLFGVRWTFHLHTQHVKEIIFNEIKIVPFHLRIYVHLQPLPAHSLSFVFSCCFGRKQHKKKTLNEFLLLCFIKRRSRIIKKCFFCVLRDLTKAMRKEFHPRPVFLDRVLFFFRLFIKNSFCALRDFWVRMARW